MKVVTPTIVYTHGGGRLGNQVLRFAHWMAWALEHAGEVEVRNLAFWPYAEYFSTWRAHPGCVFPVRPDRWDEMARCRRLLPGWVQHRLDWRMQLLVHALGRRRSSWRTVSLNDAAGEEFDLGGTDLVKKMPGGTTITCAGWRFASWKLLARHQVAVRGFLQPARDVGVKIEGFIGALRKRHGFIIGMHMRQGDYREWHDGRFRFPTEQYLRWIRQALELHAGQNPAVVLVSDARVEHVFASDLPIYRLPDPHLMNDWTALSLCDVIICPPSTFPATAAFVGGRPLWPVTTRGQVLDWTQVIADGLFGAARHPEFSLAVK